MAIIGNNNVISTTWGWTAGFNARASNDIHTALADEKITRFHFFGQSSGRDFTAFAFRTDTGALLGSTTISMTGGAAQWHSSIDLDIALPEGVGVRVGFGEVGGGNAATLRRESSTGAWETASSASIPDPWVAGSTYDFDFSFFAVTNKLTLIGSDKTYSSSGSSISLSTDAPIQENDLLLALVSNNASKSVTGLDGFTSDFAELFSTARYTVLSKVAGAAESGSYTFTLNGTDRYNAILAAFSGGDPANIYDVAPLLANFSDASGTTPTAPSITTSHDNSLALLTVSVDATSTDDINSYTNGFSEIVDSDNIGQAHTLSSKAIATAGVVGSTSATLPASRGHHALQFALREAGVAPDVTAPILSSPTGTKTGTTTADGSVSTDEGNGTLYYYATENATELSGTIELNGSSQAVSGTGVQNVSFTGLNPSTTYYAHYLHIDAATNESNVVSSAAFTTDSAFGITSAPSEISNQVNFDIEVTDPAVVPTTGNTLGGYAALKIAPIAVSGSNPYTLTFNFPRIYPETFDETGYPFELDVNAESTSTGNIPYVPQVGWKYVDLGVVNTASEIAIQSEDAPFSSGDQFTWRESTLPSSNTFTVRDDLAYSLAPSPTLEQTTVGYKIDADGTVGTEHTFRFTPP